MANGKTVITCAIMGNITKPAIWSGFGIGRAEFRWWRKPICSANLYMSKGELAKTNAELVTHAVGILRMLVPIL